MSQLHSILLIVFSLQVRSHSKALTCVFQFNIPVCKWFSCFSIAALRGENQTFLIFNTGGFANIGSEVIRN